METPKEISKKSKSSFYNALNMLPKEKRDAIHAVYAFCRKTDDIVDENNDSPVQKQKKLSDWKKELELTLAKRNSSNLVLNSLHDAIIKFKIPVDPFFDLIKGMEWDIYPREFWSFEELLQYCYLAASTVGLMSIEIFGYKNPSAKEYAVNLGYALQLTNIIRDVGTDLDNGRIYLPLEDFRKFGYTVEELKEKKYNKNFVNMMRHLAGRANEFYIIAEKHLDPEDRKSVIPAIIMRKVYYELLKKIEKSEFRVLDEKIRIPSYKKLFIAVGVWVKYNLAGK